METDFVFSMNCRQSYRTAISKLTSNYRKKDRTKYRLTAWCTQESGAKMHSNRRFSSALVMNYKFSGATRYDPCSLVTHTAERAAAYKEIQIYAGKNHNRRAQLTVLRSGLILVNVHLTSTNGDRPVAELKSIISMLDREYPGRATLVIGDFNHAPVAPGWQLIAGPVHARGKILDFAIVRNHHFATNCFAPDYTASDHGPFIVEVQH